MPSQNHPSLVEATRKALRYYPKFLTEHPLEMVADTIATMLSEGDPGLVVWVWGRQLACDVLAGIKGMDDDERVVRLREAVDGATSILDNEGGRDSAEFFTAERAAMQPPFDQYATENPAPPAPPVPAPSTAPAPVVTRAELHLREVLLSVYMSHGDQLPDGVFGPAYEGWGHRFSQPVEFNDLANLLHMGCVGHVLDVVGREYSRRILAALAQAGFFELCGTLQAAIEYGTCQYDTLGHLGPDAPELNTWS